MAKFNDDSFEGCYIADDLAEGPIANQAKRISPHLNGPQFIGKV